MVNITMVNDIHSPTMNIDFSRPQVVSQCHSAAFTKVFIGIVKINTNNLARAVVKGWYEDPRYEHALAAG